MEQPQQTPPVDRRYMRYVLGRKGKSIGGDLKARKKIKKKKPEPSPSSDGNYVLELTVFYLRPNPRRRS
jgi:hypothetical protein